MERKVSIHSVSPQHPGRGEPSYIAAFVALHYIKSEPVVEVVLTPDRALELAEQLVKAARVILRRGL